MYPGIYMNPSEIDVQSHYRNPEDGLVRGGDVVVQPSLVEVGPDNLQVLPERTNLDPSLQTTMCGIRQRLTDQCKAVLGSQQASSILLPLLGPCYE